VALLNLLPNHAGCRGPFGVSGHVEVSADSISPNLLTVLQLPSPLYAAFAFFHMPLNTATST
jgi:hypothetical protein